jgi:hypothetical protein
VTWRVVCHCGAVLYEGDDEATARLAAQHANPHRFSVLQHSRLAWDDVEVIFPKG